MSRQPIIFSLFYTKARHFSFYLYILRLLFDLLVHLILQVAITNPLTNSTPAPSHSLLDFNLNMNLDPKMAVHGHVYNMECRQPDILQELVLLEPIRQIRVS